MIEYAVLTDTTSAVRLHLVPVINLDDDQFFEFCQLNGELRIERTSEGDIIVMPPAGSDTGNKNFKLTAAFGLWAEADGTGIGFDSSAGFTLPNRAVRSPDVSWVKKERWDALLEAQRIKFAPICPDFVIELRSPSDSLRYVQAKMQEYMDNGAALGWLLDPSDKTVYVYRPGAPVERLHNPESVSGEPLLPGFALDLRRIWGE